MHPPPQDPQGNHPRGHYDYLWVVDLEGIPTFFATNLLSLNMDSVGRLFSALNPEGHKNTLYR